MVYALQVKQEDLINQVHVTMALWRTLLVYVKEIMVLCVLLTLIVLVIYVMVHVKNQLDWATLVFLVSVAMDYNAV